MSFVYDNKTRNVELKEFKFVLNTTELDDGKNLTVAYYYEGIQLAVPKGKSYHCTKAQLLNLNDGTNVNKTTGTAQISHVQFEAFHETASKDFSTALDCDAINTPGM